MRFSTRILGNMAFGLAGTGWLFAGCSDDPPSHAALAEGCVINTDCDVPLVCAFKRCHTECNDSRDCAEGQRCVASDRPFHVCQMADEKDCTRNSDCPLGMVCGIDGECRDACVTSRDCLTGQVCVSRACADPVELVDGELVQDPHASVDASASRPCLLNTDCPEPLVCMEGSCTAECRQDRDCASGNRCVNSRCTAPGAGDASAAGCVYDSDCPASTICRAAQCIAECHADRDCEPGEACSGGACIAQNQGAGGAPGAGGAGGLNAGGSAGAAAGGASGGMSGSGAGGTADAGARCVYNSDCAASQICANGACRCECREDRDCSAGFACDGCGCQREQPDGAPPEYGSPCSLSSDCLFPLVCRAEECVYECKLSTDCTEPGFCCYGHSCVSGSVCNAPADAGSGGGDACKACNSNFSCDDGVWCNGQEVCWAGCCSPALDTPCNSHSSCVLDVCTEQTHTCRSEAQAAQDADKDGHLDLGCGGDDCDDLDPKTYLGAPEYCDGKDNDCDSVRDDGSRAPFGPLVSFTDSNGHMHAVVVPVDQGWIAFPGYTGGSPVALGVQALGPTGAVIGATYSGGAGGPVAPNVYNLDAASGADRAVAVYAVSDGNYMRNQASTWTIDPAPDGGTPALRQVRTVIFGAPTPLLQQIDADVAWAGSSFIVGYGEGSSRLGYLAHIDTAGNVTAPALVPTPDGTGSIGARIRVAASRATAAALYGQFSPASQPLVTIFDSSGGILAGPVTLPAPDTATILGFAGTADGYVAVWRDATGTKSTFVAIDGVVGATLPVGGLGATITQGDGASDGEVAMFAFWEASTTSAVSFGATTGLTPLTVSSVLSGLAANGTAGIAGYGGRFALSKGHPGGYEYKQVGCLPIPP